MVAKAYEVWTFGTDVRHLLRAIMESRIREEPSVSLEPLSRRRRVTVAPHVLVVTDVVAVAGCLALASALLQHGPDSLSPSGLGATVLLALPLPVAVVGAFAANGLYVRWPRQLLASSFTEVRDIAFALALAGCLTLGFDHLFGDLERESHLEPASIVTALLLALPAVAVTRGVARTVLRATKVERFRVLLAGSGGVADRVRQYLSWDPRVVVVGVVDDDPEPGTEVLGKFLDLPRLCAELAVDEVIVAFSRTHPTDVAEILASLDPRVAVSVVPRYFELLTWRATIRELWGLPLVELAPPTLGAGARATKRTFDVAVSCLALLLAGPLMLGIAVAVKASSGGPVLFRQTRIGRHRQPFVMLKFRTMADRTVAAGGQGTGPAHGALEKPERDPRVTRVGRLLRRTSLDELPQLLNVLRGDMSLVGPRPFVAAECELITGLAERRFEVRPGMTGLWQVSGRSNLDLDDLLRLDYLYVAVWSLSWDLRILWYTPARVLRGHGAF
jgi:exopolysaccharide biosynthesis polyprenyl glycosylphosphotransferase